MIAGDLIGAESFRPQLTGWNGGHTGRSFHSLLDVTVFHLLEAFIVPDFVLPIPLKKPRNLTVVPLMRLRPKRHGATSKVLRQRERQKLRKDPINAELPRRRTMGDF